MSQPLNPFQSHNSSVFVFFYLLLMITGTMLECLKSTAHGLDLEEVLTDGASPDSGVY